MRNPIAVLLLISCFFVKLVRAQSNELLVLGQTGNLHLAHTVVAKENWYSVGRLYNLSPKDLATYNKLTLTQPLVIGQTLEIPLTAVNFSQNGQKAATETLVPVYHIVQEKEWMYRISVNHNKVPIPSLEKWNNINKDQVHAGLHMVVGYLRVKTALSALAKPGSGGAVAQGAAGSGAPATAGTGVTASSAGMKDGGVSGTKEGVSGVKDGGVAGTKDGGASGVKEGSVSGTQTAKVKERAPSRDELDSAAVAPAKGSSAGVAPASPAVGKSKVNEKETKKAEGGEETASGGGTAPVKGGAANGGTGSGGGSAASGRSASGGVTASNHNGGIFKGDFSESGKSASGMAGTFKSTSGWQDGKYYALMNNIAVGTIVKVNDGNTGKIVYAKVLGTLPDMKESAGLIIRISNAAASELGEGEGRFNVSVSY